MTISTPGEMQGFAIDRYRPGHNQALKYRDCGICARPTRKSCNRANPAIARFREIHPTEGFSLSDILNSPPFSWANLAESRADILARQTRVISGVRGYLWSGLYPGFLALKSLPVPVSLPIF